MNNTNEVNSMLIDIKVSELLDRLIFTPRQKDNLSYVRGILTERNPSIKFNRSAEGLWIRASDVGKIDLQNLKCDLNWTDTAEKFVKNRQRANLSSAKINEIKYIRDGGKEVAAAYLSKINGLKTLDDHQWVNVACMTLPDITGLCIFDEQGAGKTVTLIFAFDVLVERDEVDFAIIIAPKSMVSEWPVDFAKFMPGRYKVQTLVGSRAEKTKNLSKKIDVVVTNFETAISMEQEFRALLRKYGSRAMLVVDESFFTKNLDAKRTKAIKRLREYCGRAFVLCGTPAPNSALDIVEQFNIVDFGTTFNDVSFPKSKEETAEIIKAIIDEKGPFIRHLKADVLPDLLPKKFQKIILPMEPKQSQLYANTVEMLVTDLNEIDDTTFEKNKLSFLARRSALLQICSSPVSILKSYEETPCKILALDKVLEDLIGKKGEKVILWSFYTKSLETMFQRYMKYNPVRYDGTVTDTTVRRESVRRFREDKETMLFIANPAAAGAGLNLQSARYAIYESMSNQAAHYLQSLDRIHRRGQRNEVEYLILLCEGSIEIAEYNRLIEKEKVAQKMLGDMVVPPLTREGLLSELLI